ncbi:hypothetical protein PF002_g19562 [Phytophthora fragariae]|uniref:Uncharacterized protein n=1 Tax=Phytophthora fragariae TaxID=53985 RepID=A0A6A3XVN5_9STRA|nr:hypothetical protein PF002_g19562 [Phytophthora fragariae]
MLVMLLSLSPLPLRSPCRCDQAHGNAARRSQLAADAMLAMLLSLSPLLLRSP